MGAWIQWALCILISLLLALFLDVKAGVFLIAFFVFAGIFSGLSVLIFRKHIKLSLFSDNALLEKGEELMIFAKVERTDKGRLLRLLPAPFVTVEIQCGGGIYSEMPLSFTVMTGWSRCRTIEGKAKALYCGRSEIFIERAVLSGFLGLFHAKIPYNIDESKALAAVSPKGLELSRGLSVIQRVCAGACFSDSEETTAEQVFGAGVLGYESREYQAGDSLKSINWKLSARKDGFWVRKDEYAQRESVAFVLDSSKSPETAKENAAIGGDVLLEAVLSVCEYLLKNEIPVQFFYRKDGVWETLVLSETGNDEELKSVLANISFDGSGRFPESMPEVSALLAFTLRPDGEIAGLAKSFVGDMGYADVIFAGGMEAPYWRAVAENGQLSLMKGGAAV